MSRPSTHATTSRCLDTRRGFWQCGLEGLLGEKAKFGFNLSGVDVIAAVFDEGDQAFHRTTTGTWGLRASGFSMFRPWQIPRPASSRTVCREGRRPYIEKTPGTQRPELCSRPSGRWGKFKKTLHSTNKLIKGNKKRLLSKYGGNIGFKHSRRVNSIVVAILS